jgi:hypothetical protein
MGLAQKSMVLVLRRTEVHGTGVRSEQAVAMPVRSIPASHRSLTGRIAGTKHVGAGAFESTLERDLLLVLEFASAVTAYEVQPVMIAHADDSGRAHTYTPDVLIQRRGADGAALPPLLCEVKYHDGAKPPAPDARGTLRRTLRAGRRYAREHGWRFRLLTERDIRTPYLHNARFLLPFRTHPPRSERVARLLDGLCERGSAPADELLSAVADGPRRDVDSDYSWCVPALWHLLATGQFVADYKAPLTMQTRIYDPGHLAVGLAAGDAVAARVLSTSRGPTWLSIGPCDASCDASREVPQR